MNPLTINGLATLSAAGDRPEALAQRVADLAGAAHPGVPVGAIVTEALPHPQGQALLDFDVRARLGRRGTSFYDRATALAVVACGDALDDSGLTVDDTTRTRIGVVLGTTVGSLKSTSDYTRETLVQDKPYLVNPVLFPNTVMNCAAGQAAIRHGLKGSTPPSPAGRWPSSTPCGTPATRSAAATSTPCSSARWRSSRRTGPGPPRSAPPAARSPPGRAPRCS